VRLSRREYNQGNAGAAPEWPLRRPRVIPLPPLISTERLLELFDKNQDLSLTKLELKGRPDLFPVLDQNDDGLLSRAEIDDGTGAIAVRGVDACPDEFLARWDLDGDDEVEGDELPPGGHAAVRRAARAR
jgi:hypothetical protein